ncbi:MAG TPA: hypothetical protein ENI70_00015 [Candidatus Peregrinibacteria bacterium]|nr:hypothetical protein [Candidatus Peregrinibacteria bacterium]
MNLVISIQSWKGDKKMERNDQIRRMEEVLITLERGKKKSRVMPTKIIKKIAPLRDEIESFDLGKFGELSSTDKHCELIKLAEFCHILAEVFMSTLCLNFRAPGNNCDELSCTLSFQLAWGVADNLYKKARNVIKKHCPSEESSGLVCEEEDYNSLVEVMNDLSSRIENMVKKSWAEEGMEFKFSFSLDEPSDDGD